ncbi:hypothetical protein KFE25_012398 [Diacronema lutheri]|uniref:Uncharacterized protein n=1 Tax=Diacronema lutheri TaxID=2081491 RepID=A0A8J6CCP9_DIALT|nr:hypothetical protein KFE25_012398 [Diacronema lutheri]
MYSADAAAKAAFAELVGGQADGAQGGDDVEERVYLAHTACIYAAHDLKAARMARNRARNLLKSAQRKERRALSGERARALAAGRVASPARGAPVAAPAAAPAAAVPGAARPCAQPGCVEVQFRNGQSVVSRKVDGHDSQLPGNCLRRALAVLGVRGGVPGARSDGCENVAAFLRGCTEAPGGCVLVLHAPMDDGSPHAWSMVRIGGESGSPPNHDPAAHLRENGALVVVGGHAYALCPSSAPARDTTLLRVATSAPVPDDAHAAGRPRATAPGRPGGSTGATPPAAHPITPFVAQPPRAPARDAVDDARRQEVDAMTHQCWQEIDLLSRANAHGDADPRRAAALEEDVVDIFEQVLRYAARTGVCAAAEQAYKYFYARDTKYGVGTLGSEAMDPHPKHRTLIAIVQSYAVNKMCRILDRAGRAVCHTFRTGLKAMAAMSQALGFDGGTGGPWAPMVVVDASPHHGSGSPSASLYVMLQKTSPEELDLALLNALGLDTPFVLVASRYLRGILLDKAVDAYAKKCGLTQERRTSVAIGEFIVLFAGAEPVKIVSGALRHFSAIAPLSPLDGGFFPDRYEPNARYEAFARLIAAATSRILGTPIVIANSPLAHYLYYEAQGLRVHRARTLAEMLKELRRCCAEEFKRGAVYDLAHLRSQHPWAYALLRAFARRFATHTGGGGTPEKFEPHPPTVARERAAANLVRAARRARRAASAPKPAWKETVAAGVNALASGHVEARDRRLDDDEDDEDDAEHDEDRDPEESDTEDTPLPRGDEGDAGGGDASGDRRCTQGAAGDLEGEMGEEGGDDKVPASDTDKAPAGTGSAGPDDDDAPIRELLKNFVVRTPQAQRKSMLGSYCGLLCSLLAQCGAAQRAARAELLREVLPKDAVSDELVALLRGPTDVGALEMLAQVLASPLDQPPIDLLKQLEKHLTSMRAKAGRLGGAKLMEAKLHDGRAEHAVEMGRLGGAKLMEAKLPDGRAEHAVEMASPRLGPRLPGAKSMEAKLPDGRAKHAVEMGAKSMEAKLPDGRAKRAVEMGAKLMEAKLPDGRAKHAVEMAAMGRAHPQFERAKNIAAKVDQHSEDQLLREMYAKQVVGAVEAWAGIVKSYTRISDTNRAQACGLATLLGTVGARCADNKELAETLADARSRVAEVMLAVNCAPPERAPGHTAYPLAPSPVAQASGSHMPAVVVRTTKRKRPPLR